MKRAILLVNTGSPISPKAEDVERYLKDFLGDPRVMSIPSWIRKPLVQRVIAPRRAPQSAKKYESIWSTRGFPLQYLTEELAAKMSRIGALPVYAAMRYNRGSVDKALRQAASDGVESLVICPMMPHYAMSSYESAVAHVVERHQEGSFSFELLSVRPYFDHPTYIDLLVNQIVEHVPERTHLLFSYHSIPHAQAKPYAGNQEKDYRAQCEMMTQLICTSEKIKALNLTHEMAYQSRFGNKRWLSPFTSDRIAQLPREHKEIAVICPSFVCDNLETSWEINIYERQRFVDAGGNDLILVPCPNASDLCAQALLEVSAEERCSDAQIWTRP